MNNGIKDKRKIQNVKNRVFHQSSFLARSENVTITVKVTQEEKQKTAV